MDKIKVEIDGVEAEVEVSEEEKLKNMGIKVENKTFKSIKYSSWKKKVIGVTPLLATVAYLLLGYCLKLWHPGWVVFLAIPIVPMILHMFDGGVKTGIVSITFILTIVGYLVLGFVFKLWHPGWMIFFLLPIVSILVGEKHD